MMKLQRLRKNQDFQKVYKKGKSTANRQFIVYVLRGENQKFSRLGLSVSKKMGNAVVRNKIRRHVKEAMRAMEGKIQLGNDYIIISRKPAADMTYTEVKSSLQHVLKRACVFHEKRG